MSSIERYRNLARLQNELASIKAYPVSSINEELLYIEGEHPYRSLKDFVDAYRKYEESRKLLVWVGYPGSGKTRLREKAKSYRKQLHEDITGIELPIGDWPWEAGEDLARRDGAITTPDDEPFTWQELDAASRRWGDGLHDGILLYPDVDGEAPVVPAARYKNRSNSKVIKKGRELGYDALYDLTRGIRADLIDLPPFDIWVAAVKAGPYLRSVVPPFRYAIKRVKSFEEGIAVCVVCGLEPPENEEELKFMQSTGADPKQMRLIRRSTRGLLQRSYRMVNPDNSVLSVEDHLEAVHLKYVLSDEDNLGLRVSRYFIADNDPHLTTPDPELLQRFIKSRGRMRFKDPVLIKLLLDHVAEAPDRLD